MRKFDEIYIRVYGHRKKVINFRSFARGKIYLYVRRLLRRDRSSRTRTFSPRCYLREILQIKERKKFSLSASKLFAASVNSNLFSARDGLLATTKRISVTSIYLQSPPVRCRMHFLEATSRTDVGRAILPQQEQRFPIWQSETEDNAATTTTTTTSSRSVNFSPDKSVVTRFFAAQE